MKKQERIGEPTTHKKIQKARKNIKEIRGIYRAWLKAKKFVLRLEAANHVRIYVTSKGLLGSKIEAKEFKEGFDDPEVKRKYWSNKLGIKLITERI